MQRTGISVGSRGATTQMYMTLLMREKEYLFLFTPLPHFDEHSGIFMGKESNLEDKAEIPVGI